MTALTFPRGGGGAALTRFDVAKASRRLIGSLVSQPWGQVSASIYETARLVALVPSLTGHSERLDFLARTQRPDGAWGTVAGYRLVPTLSAVEALLRALDRDDAGIRATTIGRAGLHRAAAAGLHAARGWLRDTDRRNLPDMPAIEIIVPGLLVSINELLAGATAADAVRATPLPMPTGMHAGVVELIRARLASGASIELKLVHALEVAGESARGAAAVRSASTGAVGASPAATAAWVDPATALDSPAWAYLETTVAQGGSAVPCTTPITVFERAWVLSNLSRAGLTPRPPAEMIRALQRALGESGTPTSSGLPPDADTTAVTLFALGRLGLRPDVDCLRGFELETRFCTWQGEDGASTTVNAHVLEALGLWIATGAEPTTGGWAPTAAAKAADWLVAAQATDGSWRDRWHASPYYATAASVQALAEFAPDRTTPDCLARAVDWVLASQRVDGSWGIWHATVEETAYAVQTLVAGAARGDRRIEPAVRRATAFLVASVPAQVPADGAMGISAEVQPLPALWHDKDLYAPTAIVRAAALAALHLAQSAVAATPPRPRKPPP